MNKLRLYSLLMMVLMSIAATAQEVNKLYLGSLSCMKSQTVELPFYVENTSPDITALQVDITLPKGAYFPYGGAVTMDEMRVDDHRVKVELLSQATGYYRYRVMMVSPTNSPIRANKGKVFTIQTEVPSSAELDEGETYPIEVYGVFLSNQSGQNIVTEYEGGSITIAPSPDFTVSDVQLTAVNGDAGVTTLSPGDNFSVKWTVNNVGSAASEAGWSEQIIFVSTTTGERCTVATSRHINERLESGASLELSDDFTVPRILGLDGLCRVLVELTPSSASGEHAEYQHNNSATSSGICYLNKRLYLSLQQAEITEPGNGISRSYYARLERSGNRMQEETFPVAITQGDSRLSLEEDAFTFSQSTSATSIAYVVTDDDQLNGDFVDFAFAVSAAEGYEAVSVTGQLIDDEYPDLQVGISKTKIDEGDEFELTITPSRAPAEDLTVLLTSDAPTRFKIPANVVIPAGSTAAVVVSVTAYDDNVVADEIAVRFTAAASRYNSGYAACFDTGFTGDCDIGSACLC